MEKITSGSVGLAPGAGWRYFFAGRIMPANLNHYRTALYLSIVVALTNAVVCGLSVFLRPQNVRDAIGLCVLSLVIPAGLWLGSNFLRFAGAVFLVLWGGVLLWPWVSSGAALRPGQLSVALVFGFSAALSLLTAAILLLSKKFSTEFAEERKELPKYKINLRRALLTAIVGAMIIATVIDIFHLASGG